MTNQFKYLSFSVFHKEGANQKCADIIFHFKKNNKIIFKVVITNSGKNAVEIMNPHKYHRNPQIEIVKCNKWIDYWLVFTKDTITFGNGLIYNVNTRVTVNYPIGNLSPVLSYRDYSSYQNDMKINDLG